MTEKIQHKQENQKVNKELKGPPKMKFRPVSAKTIREINKLTEPKKYVEWRQGTFKALMDHLGNRTLQPEKTAKFTESVTTSKEIKELMDNELVGKIDRVNGPLKLILTIYGKWVESRLS